VGIALWLVRTNEWWLTTFWRHISQPFAEAALTKLRGTSAKLDGIICTEWRKAKLHCPIMFIAERQNVRAHWSSLASMETFAFRWLSLTRRNAGTHQPDVPAHGANKLLSFEYGRSEYGNPGLVCGYELQTRCVGVHSRSVNEELKIASGL
jgi:hypothetical protein